MPTLSDIQGNIEKAKLAEKAARARLSKAKRSYSKHFRQTEKQALCASGRGLLALYESRPALRSDIIDFMRGYLTRDSDLDAIQSALGDTPLGRDLDAGGHIPIEVVG